jgi:hypothetical protein
MLLDRQVKSTGLKPGPLSGESRKRDLDSAMRDPRALAEWKSEDPEGYEAAVSDRFFADAQRKAKERVAKLKGK